MRSPVINRAFTLIELLVVVSIIAVLIAILLPALKSARGLARTVQCASTQRQLAIAQNLYADDWNDQYAAWQNTTPPAAPDPNRYTWQRRLLPYFDREHYAGSGGDPWQTWNRDPLISCPDWTPHNSLSSAIRAFGLNIKMQDSHWNWKRNVVPLPQATALLSEINRDSSAFIPDNLAPPPTTASDVETFYRLSHEGTAVANYLFVDSHVETLSGIRNNFSPDDAYATFPQYKWW